MRAATTAAAVSAVSAALSAPTWALGLSARDLALLTDALQVVAAALLCSAGALWLARWRLTDEAAVASAAAALFLVAALVLPLDMASGLVYDEPRWQRLNPLSWTVLTPVAVVLLACSARRAGAGSSCRPMVTVSALGCLVALVFLFGALLHERWDVSFDPAPERVQLAEWGAALLWWLVAVHHLRHGLRRAGPPHTGTAAALAVLGLGCAYRGVAVELGQPWLFAAALLTAVAAVLAVWTAMEDLVEVYAREGDRYVRLTGALADTEQLLSIDAQRREEMVHDAQSVIAAVRAASSTLVTYGEGLEPQVRDGLRTAVTSELARLERLLDRPAVAELRDFDVSRALEPVLTAQRRRGGVLEARVPSVLAHGNAEDLATVVANLLDNARCHAPGSPVEVWADEGGGDVWVYVADRGPGVTPTEREAIFRRGVRGAGSDQVPGRGLGLYICHRLVEAQHGAIDVHPRPGGGACFVVRLPAARGRRGLLTGPSARGGRGAGEGR